MFFWFFENETSTEIHLAMSGQTSVQVIPSNLLKNYKKKPTICLFDV